jgi:excinuclease ABC subunit C
MTELLPISDQVKALPELPGVYRYYDNGGALLYIGKAKNIRKRVSSYFIGEAKHAARIKLLVKKIAVVQHTVVDTERDALLLENSLIKEYQPKYNIALKDDKSFPYIKIVHERFPRIYFSRNYKKDGSEYFGPYTSVHQVRSLVELIKKLYPIRSCKLALSDKNIQSRKFRVCLEYHIGNCLGPCAGHQTEPEYNQNISEIRAMLKGKLADIRQILKGKMEEAALSLRFEEAEQWKIKLNSLKEYMDLSMIVNPGLGNMHVFGYYEDEKKAYVNYLYVFNGTVVKAKNMTILRKMNEDKDYLLWHAILEVIPELTSQEDILVSFLPSEQFADFELHVPKQGDKKKLLDLSLKNAFFIKQNELKKNTKLSNEDRILQLMKEELRMKETPAHIECFDNSNIQGAFPVASMVVFKNSKPSKADYRHFNIKTVEGPNDFASMEEVVYRRYKRLLEENAPLPQLIVIDGGKGQLSSAVESLKKLGLYEKIQVVSIAKRLEEIYYPGDRLPLYISKKSETLKVLQHIRNEAHRFAINFHRDQRSKGTIKTDLSEVPGIGQKTAEKLLTEIGSVQKIRAANLETISKVIGKAKALLVYQYFHPERQQ